MSGQFGIWERHQSGRIDFHLVVALCDDIRTGADFEAFKRKENLRCETGRIKGGVGILERVVSKVPVLVVTKLMPVNRTAEGIARYVGKYISKHSPAEIDNGQGSADCAFHSVTGAGEIKDRTGALRWDNLGGLAVASQRWQRLRDRILGSINP